MGGSRCSYKNCTSRRIPKAKPEDAICMFRYPVLDKARCYQWLLNAQKLSFLSLLNDSQLRNRFVCQYHFRDDDFNINRKNSLKFNAVPTLDGPYCNPTQAFDNENNYEYYSSKEPMFDENEIEIEEHDVLDNPTIKRIFPDLSIIKEEISQYEQGLMRSAEDATQEVIVSKVVEAEPSVQQHVASIATPHVEAKFQETIQTASPRVTADMQPQEFIKQAPIDTKLATHLRFKTFLDSLADDFSDIDNNSDSRSSTITQSFTDNTFSKGRNLTNIKIENRDYKCIRNNVFILGSKPIVKDSKLTVNKIKEVKILLEDVSSYLNMSNQYCKQCLILFPDVDAFKSHTSKIHLSKQNNRISKNKNAVKLKLKNKIKCNFCKIPCRFSSIGNLNKHIRSFHKNINLNSVHKSKRLPRRTARNKKSKTLKCDIDVESTKNHRCFHCTKVFETSSLLIEHLYEVITPNYSGSDNSVEGKQIEKSNVVDESTNNDSVIVCQKVTCSTISFLTQRDLDQHTKATHVIKKSSPNNKYTYNKRKVSKRSNSVGKEVSLIEEEEESSDIHNTANSECSENKKSKMNTYNLRTDDNMDDFHYTTDDNEHETSLANSNTKVEGKLIYQCFVCSQYITYFKWFSVHMLNHNIKISSEMAKSVFNPQCKFCNFKNSNIECYNKHISNDHSEIKIKKVQLDDKAFQSALFKCLKCNIFFLSANAARSHSEHKAIFVDWKCTHCERTFKVKDKPLHLKQHLISENIIAYALSESALGRLLYKCLKCAVHFSEREYFLHSATCVLNAPNSAYCNPCDILINKSDMALHKHYHKNKKRGPCDFTFIESDYVVNDVMKNTNEKVNMYAQSKFALTFCHTCNCFVGNLGRKRKAHIEGRCDVICHRMCMQCGLIFTNKGYLSHKMLHEKVKDLTLQTFYFYDIKTKKQMRPPLPKYPSCSICHIHFLNKKTIKEHECHLQKFTTCDICNIKLTETAFRLHRNFHNYKLSACNKKLVIRYKHVNALTNSAVSNISESDESSAAKDDAFNISKKVTMEQCNLQYTCFCCRITVDNYDKVIQHCHDHYGYNVIHNNDQKYSKSNDEKVDQSILFDPFYFRFDNDVWIKHIFGHLTQKQINEIVDNSIYKSECRLKMDLVQTGPSSLSLYKCDVCRSYVDPSTLYLHASSTCNLNKKHPCSHCGLCFYSQSYRTVHEKIHTRIGINLASYKIILFNKTEHQHFAKIMFNSCNKFILYICRNCEVVVDKVQRANHQCCNAAVSKCSYCGLLIYEQEYNSHVDKHEKITDFNTDNIIAVKFGKLEVQKDDTSKISFKGTVYDLSFYKCGNCGLYLTTKKEMLEHVCVTKSSMSGCPKCHLCFLNENLDAHMQLHETLIELDSGDFNCNIIDFNLSTLERSVTPTDSQNKCKEIKHSISKTLENNSIDEDVVKDDPNTFITQTLYKCKCGLHFLEESNSIRHSKCCYPKGKISRQNCFRCSLLFTPGELFNHLLKHHSDKKLQYKYDIISIN